MIMTGTYVKVLHWVPSEGTKDNYKEQEAWSLNQDVWSISIHMVWCVSSEYSVCWCMQMM
jgi:hypothetical protein